MPWDTVQKIVSDYISHGYPGYGLAALIVIVSGASVGFKRMADAGVWAKRSWHRRRKG